MNAFSPIHAYALGAAFLGLGLHAHLLPEEEYTRFGLPLERVSHPRERAVIAKPDALLRAGVVSPLMQVKATREASYGLALLALQYQGNTAGVTTLTAVVSLAALGDGLVVWCRGGARRRDKAWVHWAGALALAGWAGWRLFLGYGEWMAFYAFV